MIFPHRRPQNSTRISFLNILIWDLSYKENLWSHCVRRNYRIFKYWWYKDMPTQNSAFALYIFKYICIYKKLNMCLF
jgi:hypothetical protein